VKISLVFLRNVLYIYVTNKQTSANESNLLGGKRSSNNNN